MPTLSLACLLPLVTPEGCLSLPVTQGAHSHLTPRGLGTGGTTVFGVVIAVGFASLVLFCGLGSRAYRRVAQQQQYMVIANTQLDSTILDELRESPQLWDLSIEEEAKQKVWEWDSELPMSASLKLTESVDSGSVLNNNEKLSHRRRGKVRAPIDLKPITESSGSVNVTVLIAMPSPRTSTLTSDWRSDDKVRFNDDEELWSGYTIGTTCVGYVGD